MKKRILSVLLALTLAVSASATAVLAENESDGSSEPTSSVTSPEVTETPAPSPTPDISSDTSSDTSSDVPPPMGIVYEYTPTLTRTGVNVGNSATLHMVLTKNESTDFSFTHFNATVSVPFPITNARYTLAGTERTVDVEKNGNRYVFDVAYSGGVVSAAGGLDIRFTVSEEADLGTFNITLNNVELCEENGVLTSARGTANTLRITLGERYPTLTDLAVEGFDLSPAFSADVDRYTVTVPADTAEAVICATTKSDSATVAYQGQIYENGVVPVVLVEDSMTVVLTVSSGGSSTYRITFVKEGAEVSDVSSNETSSEEVPSLVGSVDTSSEDVSSTPESGSVGGTVSVPGNDDGKKNGLGAVAILLIVLLALACGFVFCLILVRNGVFGGKDNESDDGFEKPVDEEAFQKASTAQKTMGAAYTATRVMPIPKMNTEKPASAEKFEVKIAEEDIPDVPPVVPAEKTEEKKEETAFRVFKLEPETAEEEVKFGVPAEETKPEEPKKKKSFFFDDEEF